MSIPQTENQETGYQSGITEADVTFGDVSLDDDTLFVADEQSGVYTDYEIINRYEKDLHRYMAGITSPGGFAGNSVAFFQLAAPTLLWICDWTAERWGQMPHIPPSDPKDGLILLDEMPEARMLQIAADGTTGVYRLSGTYVYGFLNPSDSVWTDVCIGRPPWLEDKLDRCPSLGILEDNLITCPCSSSSSTSPGGSDNSGGNQD